MFKYVFSAILVLMSFFGFVFDIGFTNQTIGRLFVAGILGCFAVFLFFKFGLHYKILTLNRFADAFYFAVFEYKKAQIDPSGLTYMDSVREQAEVALAANFDPTLKTADLKIPATLYSGKNPLLDKLRARIQKAEKIKLEARHLDRKANILLGQTQQIMVEKDLAEKKDGRLLDRLFDTENGVAAIIDLTVGEIREQRYARAPDYEIITRIAFDSNPHFSRTCKFFESEDILGVIFRAPFMIILLGIIGTFAGFYLALNQGGDIKTGASVAIISSLVGLPVSLLMDYINTLFPDKEQYQQAFNKYKISLEMLFNHEQELNTDEDEGLAAKYEKEKELALAEAEQKRVDALAKAEQERVEALAKAEQERAEALGKVEQERADALEKAEQKQIEALSKQEEEHDILRQLEVAKTAQEAKEQAGSEAAKLKEEKERALAEAEQKQVDALAKQEAELEKKRQKEVSKAAQELRKQAEREAAEMKKEKERALAEAQSETAKLKKEKELALAKAEQERLDALAKQEAELEKKSQQSLSKKEQELKKQAELEAADLKKEKESALAKLENAEQEQADALAKQEAELEKQRQLEVAKTARELREQAEREAADMKKEKERALAEAQSETANLKKEKEAALAKAEQEQVDALAKQEAELEKQRQLEVAEAAQEAKEQAENEIAKLKKEKELALADADKEKAKALSEKEKVFTKKLAEQKKLLAKVAEEFSAQS